MSAMDDVFGKRPGRVDHPDFWRISEILLRHDGALEKLPAEEREAAWKGLVAEHVDLDSVMYVATQRTLRALDILTMADLRKLQRTKAGRRQATLMVTMFVDGFVTGAEFGEQRKDEA